MPGIPTQYDLQAGLQLNALSSITREQLLQAISQAAPLNNVGGVLWFSGNNGNDFPSVLNNPRYARYIWIDTYYDPVQVKVYDKSGGDTFGNWVEFGLGEDAVLGTHIKQDAVAIYDVADKKIALLETGIPDPTKRLYALRIDSAGQRVEVVSVSDLLGLGGVTIDRLVAGADNQFLRINGTTVSWETINFAAELAAQSVSLSKLSSGGAADNWVLVSDGAGGIEAISNSDSSLLADGSILPIKLSGAGAASGYILKYNGTYWEAVTPPLGFTSSALVSTDGIEVGSFIPQTGNWSDSIAHGLGAVYPKLVRVVVKCISSANGYAAGDELDLSAIVWNDGSGTNANDGWQAISFVADTVNISVLSPNVGPTTRYIYEKSGSFAAMAANSFKVKIYAWP